ncbi:MAG: LysR family transcriptional regulator [Acidovorax temperans]|uniref:LysR family transcriptional regulator n=1 Tax=Acidovorax temperans TaxID=80878 RepID=UPI00391BEF87
MDNVDIRLLRAFLALMAERSVTRAADKLGVGQSAMSQTLARLRILFSDPLLLKSRGGMAATDRALELERSVRLMLYEYDQMLTPAESFEPATSRRRFVISAPEYAEHLLMPPVLARLREVAPGVRLDVRAPQPARSAELLENGELDLRIAWLLTPTPSLRSMQLFQDHIVCLASQSHRAIQGSLTLDQFLEWPHVQPLGTGRPTTAVVLADAVAREGRKIERTFLVQNFLTIPLIIARTDMLATLPHMLAISFATQHKLQVLQMPMRLPRVRYAAYWHERSQKDLAHRWLRGLVLDAARALMAG